MVWKGLVAVPAVLVNWPVRIGTFWPTRMVATSLSSVIRLGVDRMLVLPSDSSEWAIAPRPTLLNRPSDKPSPGSTAPLPVASAVRLLLVPPVEKDCKVPTRYLLVLLPLAPSHCTPNSEA